MARLLLVIMSMLASAGPAAAGQASWTARPLPAASALPTDAQRRERGRELRLEMSVGALRRHNPAAPYLDDAVAFLEGYDRVYSDDATPSAKDRGPLVEQAQALLAAGCDDVIVLNRIGFVLNEWTRRERNPVLPVVDEVFDRLDESPYGPLERFWAGRLGLETLKAAPSDQASAARYRRAIVDGVVGACRRGEIAEDDARFFDNVFLYDLDPDHHRLSPEMIAEVLERLKAHEDPNEWLRSVLVGGILIEQAWEERGGAWAGEVAPEQWRGFYDKLDEAERWLLKAHELRPDFPEAAAHMIKVVMGRGARDHRDERYWFDQAVAAQFDMAPAYASYLWAMRPRWGGSHEAMARFGFECARTERYDTDVPLQLMEAVLLIGRDLDGDLSLLRRRPGVYRLLRSAIRGRIEHLEAKGPPGRRTSERVADLWADLACAAWWRGDWRTLADADAASRRLFQSRRFDEWRVSRRDVMHDRWLMNSPQAFTIRRADAALRAGRGVRAVQLLGRAREGLSSGGERGWPQLREALDDRLAAAALGAALERGGWIDVALPTDGVEAPGWRSVAGLWLRADGAAGCQFSIADEDRGARLVCMLPIGRGFEASVDLDFTSSGGSPYVIGGLVFDHPGGRDEPFYGVAVYPNADRILVTLDGVVLGRDHPIGAKCTLGVIVREASLSVIIDGEMVVRDLEAPRQERGGSCFGLGSGGWWDTGEANYAASDCGASTAGESRAGARQRGLRCGPCDPSPFSPRRACSPTTPIAGAIIGSTASSSVR